MDPVKELYSRLDTIRTLMLYRLKSKGHLVRNGVGLLLVS